MRLFQAGVGTQPREPSSPPPRVCVSSKPELEPGEAVDQSLWCGVWPPQRPLDCQARLRPMRRGLNSQRCHSPVPVLVVIESCTWNAVCAGDRRHGAQRWLWTTLKQKSGQGSFPQRHRVKGKGSVTADTRALRSLPHAVRRMSLMRLLD